MSNWFARQFSRVSEFVTEHGREAIAQTRHEFMGAWFGRNFEPYPRSQPEAHARPAPNERDIHGNERAQDHGRER